MSRYISISTDPNIYAQLLTDRVCEVEDIVLRKIPDEVVIGYVRSVVKHPDADKLVICQLDCGKVWNFQICTWATNIKEGQYVPVAVPWCHLPAINLTIEPRTMRGEDSNGMICSKNELWMWLDAGKHWIWVIQGEWLRTDVDKWEDPYAGDINTLTPDDTWKKLSQIFPWLEGWIIDVENKTITHRPDLFGHFGLAVETRTLFSEDVTFSRLPELIEQMHEWKLLEVMAHSTPSNQDIHIQSWACRCYSLVSYSNVSVQPSDLFTKLALIDIGIQSTNNRVDFSNLFMQTTGQPVHFFDADLIVGTIVIRQALQDEQFVDLFDTTHTLTENDLVIADDNGVVALAWVVWWKRTWVSEKTKNIAVEIANFDPVMIRKTALRLWLRTEAQIRYEKDINPLYTLSCVQLFQDELKYYASSLWTPTFLGVQRDLTNGETPLYHRIAYDSVRIRSQVMWTQDSEQWHQVIQKIFKGLWFAVKNAEVITPAWRWPDDLTGQHDLVEEVARHIGFNTIPERTLRSPLQFAPLTPSKRLIKDIESLLSDTYWLNQLQTYSWMHDQWLPYLQNKPTYTIKNAIDSDRTSMRTSMLRWMIEMLQKNQWTFETMNFFDIGRCWDEEWKEHSMVGMLLAWPSSQDRDKHPQHHLKTIIHHVLQCANVRGKFDLLKTALGYAHPLQQAILQLNRTQYGRILTLHPSFCEKHNLNEGMTICFVEVSLTTLLELRSNKKSKKSFSSLKDHCIRRDVAFLIDQAAEYWVITDAVSKVREVEKVEVFDLFAGKWMPEWKKSIGLRYKTTFSQTPTTEQINEILNKVISAGQKWWWELRGK